MRALPALLLVALTATACASSGQRSTLARADVPEIVETDVAPAAATPPSSTPAEPPAPAVTEPPPEPEPPAGLVKPTVPTDPAATAAMIEAAERATRAGPAGDPAVAQAAFDLQVAYRELARRPDLDETVLAAVDPALQATVRANLAARREFRGMHRKLSDTLPAWRIVDPAPADELLTYYREAEETFGIPWNVLAAINLVETGMGRIRGTSVAGAQGPMQFIPSTWEAFGEGDINDPRDAIMAAARYLNHNNGHAGNLEGALFRYNNHNNYVRGVLAYAGIMAEDPAAYTGFYHWQIVYLSEVGDIWLPVGYEAAERVAVTDYVAANPDHHLGTATD